MEWTRTKLNGNEKLRLSGQNVFLLFMPLTSDKRNRRNMFSPSGRFFKNRCSSSLRFGVLVTDIFYCYKDHRETFLQNMGVVIWVY